MSHYFNDDIMLKGVVSSPGINPMQKSIGDLNLAKFVNKSGSTIAVGELLKPDIVGGKITVQAATAVTNSTAITLANDLDSEAGIFRLVFTNSTHAFLALAAGIVIVGEDENGNVNGETLATTTSGNYVLVSVNLYTKITSITPGIILDSGSKLTVEAYCVNAFDQIASAAADDTAVCGICYGDVDGFNVDAVADEGTGWISLPGPIVSGLVEPASLTPGTRVGSGASVAGTFGALSTPAAGGALGVILDCMGNMNTASLRRRVLLRGS